MVCVRTEKVNKLLGGFSGLLASVMMTFFGAQGHNVKLAGISLALQDGSRQHVWMSLAAFLADEAAIHAGLCCKGSSGLKPCVLCANIFNFNIRRDIVARDATGVAQHHVIHDVSKLKLHTKDTIEAIIRRLEADHNTLNQREFAELQTTLGWNYAPGSIMFNEVTRSLIDPTSTTTYDWMHIIFVHGIFGANMGQVMLKLKEQGVTYAKLHSYLQDFKWPRSISTVSGKDTCEPKRAKSCWSDGLFKATASESLSVLPVFANYFTDFIHGNPPPAAFAKGVAANLLQLVRIVELIIRSSRCSVAPVLLQNAIKEYLEGYVQLHGPEGMIIKFHYLLHLPAFLKKHGFLPNCFVHERKHRMPKRFANHNMNITSAWDSSVTKDVTCHHLQALQEDDGRFDVRSSLIQAHAPSKRILNALVSQFGEGNYMVANRARSPTYEQFYRRDMVIYREAGAQSLGQVTMIVSAEVNGECILVAVVDDFAHVRNTRRGDEWRPSGMRRVCHLDAILGAVVWRNVGPDRILT